MREECHLRPAYSAKCATIKEAAAIRLTLRNDDRCYARRSTTPACRARSQAEFRAKLGIVEEEADESIYWMELLIDTEVVREELLADLIKEANEILSMVVASIRTSRKSEK